ncbi:AbiH family protein [Flavobacterium terrigena]|uniref:Bacteriophage abortive infection AbiH n=1 Tax=Flavobacterium terrigena TaxID=402734 RepID=A0A1H6QFV5_9FLAO|nr:AbiH family protein [Flavobacterium terrigena]SEI42573.1 Bacteriophage abortive infection AbiH [Flavobacterium terrigena]
MNRLIIIGNGFDLAHGIKTNYHDFILDYLKTCLIECSESGSFTMSSSHFERIGGYFKDDLLEIKLRTKYSNVIYTEKIKEFQTIKELVEFYKRNEFSITHSFELLLNTINEYCTLNWVDLEDRYFDLLVKYGSTALKKNNIDKIKLINDKFEILKQLLQEYLIKQQLQFSNLSNKEPLVDCFCDKIYKNELVTITLEESIFPENLYFLNFNYTNTFEDYFRDCRIKIPSNFNYIHGNLHGVHGNAIFGFGDELDKRYLGFEDEKNNELFKHIKSFEYLKTKNYYLLTRFIESQDFQVHIYGHSCGISDRTMLNQIFEHENCKSIKIYYHKKSDGSNDYTEKIYEISRHFKDKGMMRKKIVPFDLSSEMPQPNKGIK